MTLKYSGKRAFEKTSWRGDSRDAGRPELPPRIAAALALHHARRICRVRIRLVRIEKLHHPDMQLLQTRALRSAVQPMFDQPSATIQNTDGVLNCVIRAAGQ